VPRPVSSRHFQGAGGFYISIPEAAHQSVLASGYLLLLFQSKESKSRNKSYLTMRTSFVTFNCDEHYQDTKRVKPFTIVECRFFYQSDEADKKPIDDWLK